MTAAAYPSPAVTARTEWPVVSDRVGDLIGAATAAAGVPLAWAAALTERCAVDPVGDRSGLAASGTRFVSRRIRPGATDADGAAAGVADRGVSLPAASRAPDQVSTAVAASADLRLVASVRQCPHVAAVGTPHPMNLGIPFGECGEEPLQPGWPIRATGGETAWMRAEMVEHRPGLRCGQVYVADLFGEPVDIGIRQPRREDCGEVGDRLLPLLGVGAGGHSPRGRRWWCAARAAAVPRHRCRRPSCGPARR